MLHALSGCSGFPLRARAGRGGGRRSQGAVDPVDLAVGGVLLLLIPLLTYVIALSLGFGAEDLTRELPRVPPPMTDEEEVRLHWSVAENLYERNAKAFLDARAATSEDPILTDSFRRWAKRCLENSDSELKELEVLIGQYPATKQKFAKTLSDSAILRAKIAAELKRLDEFDILQLDSR